MPRCVAATLLCVSLSETPLTRTLSPSHAHGRISSLSLTHTEAVLSVPLLDARYSSRFKNNCFAEMRSGSGEGSYLRLVDFGITQLEAESNNEERSTGLVEGLRVSGARLRVSGFGFRVSG